LFYVVKYISDKVDRHLINLIYPLLDDLEYVFARVGTADVRNDVLSVRVMNSEHLNNFFFVFNLFLQLVLDIFHKVHFPRTGMFADNTREGESSYNKEVLMDLVEQVLQVGVDTGLGVDGVLFISQEVVELDDTNGDGFKLLRH